MPFICVGLCAAGCGKKKEELPEKTTSLNFSTNPHHNVDPLPQRKTLTKKPNPPKTLPPDEEDPLATEFESLGITPNFVMKWRTAGFSPGLIGENSNNGEIFFTDKRSRYKISNAIPAFRAFRQWNSEQVRSLPSPATAFGLSLKHSQVTDSGLKELTRFKHLATFILGGHLLTFQMLDSRRSPSSKTSNHLHW